MAGRKIFVSYKYSDSDVQRLPLLTGPHEVTTARHYVDLLCRLLDADDHIYKGENDNESLADFKDGTIGTKLKGKIYDSSVTIVLLSPRMKELGCPENDQWIPWEISWSLRELNRDDRTSGTNAMLAVALPDSSGRYDHAVVHGTCPHCNCTTWQTDSMFGILANNMFNRKNPRRNACQGHWPGGEPYVGNDHSFIYPVRWDTFIQNVGLHLDIACAIRGEIDSYELRKIP